MSASKWCFTVYSYRVDPVSCVGLVSAITCYGNDLLNKYVKNYITNLLLMFMIIQTVNLELKKQHPVDKGW